MAEDLRDRRPKHLRELDEKIPDEEVKKSFMAQLDKRREQAIKEGQKKDLLPKPALNQ